jgi:citronellol/citronellal dehydrogenase
VTRNSRACTGGLRLDEDVLKEEGVTDLDRYRVDPSLPLTLDLFVG